MQKGVRVVANSHVAHTCSISIDFLSSFRSILISYAVYVLHFCRICNYFYLFISAVSLQNVALSYMIEKVNILCLKQYHEKNMKK